MRHYGLQLIQHAIRYSFVNYDLEQKLAIRNWIIDLAVSVQPEDPYYLKEKVAILWVAVAKRVWGLDLENTLTSQESVNGNHNGIEKTDMLDEDIDKLDDNDDSLPFDGTFDRTDQGWTDMDKIIFNMWKSGPATRELTFSIFRTLFEDLYLLDDPVADKRATALVAQCIEVVSSESVLHTMYQTTIPPLKSMKYGRQGWLVRWSSFLKECLEADINDPTVSKLAIKVLNTLKTCLHWVFPLAIRQAQLLQNLSVAIRCSNIEIRILAVESLHILFTRPYSDDEDFQSIVGSVFYPDSLNMLAQVYQGIQLNIDNFNEQEYVLCKRMVEMIVGLGEYLNVSKNRLPKEASLKQYLFLVLQTTNNSSLVVSGMSLQFWCSVLRVNKLNSRPEIQELLPQLLEIASERCIKFDDVGDDHIARRFVTLEFDSESEIQVFLGNYRKFMEDIVRLVVCIVPQPSLTWLESRMDAFFSSDIGRDSLESRSLTYSGNPAYFLAYSQFILVECALRGVTRWRVWYTLPDTDNIRQQLSVIIERWCQRLIAMKINDPMLLRKYVQTLVQFAPSLLALPNLVFCVLEKVLMACTFEYPPNATDEEREIVRDLRTSCGTELNRLAYMMPTVLMQIYDDLERVIGETIASNKLSDHESVAFLSFLLVVSQRSDVSNKSERFSKIVDPVLSSWTDEGTVKGLMDLPWFMERVGIVKIAEYFRSRGVTVSTNLLNTNMDDQGKALKAELKSKWSALFPIRATRIFIQYTIEKLDHHSEPYKELLALWKPRIQPILPHILQLIAQIQAYHNPANWATLPEEVQSFVKYSCQERFWQIGVSTQTKDEFVDENVRAMHTLRDFADSVGHIIRYTREYAFLTLGSISQLEETIYEIPGIAENLFRALAGDSAGITLHSWRHMTSLVLRNLVKNCPARLMDTFLVEFLPLVLNKLDEVLCEKWEKVYKTGIMIQGDEDVEDLSEEMMEEHLLRQLTAVVDRFLIDLAGQLGGKPSSTESVSSDQTAALRKIVLGNKKILGPFLTLSTHILAFKDSRCSFNTCLIFRSILPSIMCEDADVDNFLCDYLVKTCLDVLGDKYFADVHHEAGYVLTMVYMRLREQSKRPYDVLAALLPRVPQDMLQDFEKKITATKSIRQQRGEFLDFLAQARQISGSGLNGSGNGVDGDGAYDANQRDARQRKQEKKNEKEKRLLRRKKPTDLMETEELQTSMVNLFDEGY